LSLICSPASLRSVLHVGVALYLALGWIAVVSAACRAQGDPEQRRASVTIRDREGDVVGRATLTEGAVGIVIKAELEGLPPGTHAFHVHETGVCEPPFQSAGAHLSVSGSEHGILSPGGMHVGDLPNVHLPESGSIEVDAFLEGATLGEGGELLPLLDEDGSALVLHAGADDYRTDPAGNAGDRIACGIITR
jgi:superoxide dismutase, Cu-Zn family